MNNDHLQPNSMVGRWTVQRLLGEGGFGAVYMVTDATNRSFALKVEQLNAVPQLLQMEVLVLNELHARQGRHFCKIEDRGRIRTFNYVVMTMVGKSLEDLVAERPAHRFSMGTAISSGIQCLEALEDLHKCGYLHRDVKPANYTIGRAENGELRKVYILDFGMARKYVNDQNVMRRPRAVAGFRGTVRYAAISCHDQRDLCRKDDIESWLYTLIELTRGSLPWANMHAAPEVGVVKKRVRQNPIDLLKDCPREYERILQHVDALTFYDRPNYELIYKLLREAMSNTGAVEFPYDWERPGGGQIRGVF
jgi:tau tubulin kinase